MYYSSYIMQNHLHESKCTWASWYAAENTSYTIQIHVQHSEQVRVKQRWCQNEWKWSSLTEFDNMDQGRTKIKTIIHSGVNMEKTAEKSQNSQWSRQHHKLNNNKMHRGIDNVEVFPTKEQCNSMLQKITRMKISSNTNIYNKCNRKCTWTRMRKLERSSTGMVSSSIQHDAAIL